MKQRIAATVICFFLVAGHGTAWALDCSRGDALVDEAMAQGSPEARMAALKDLLASCADNAKALNNLGCLYEEQGDLATALAYYQKALDSDPDLPHPYVGLGDIYTKQGLTEKAAAAYRTVLELSRNRGVRDAYPELDGCLPRIRGTLEEHGESPEGLVVAEAIVRGLTRRYRSISIKPRVPLKINFAYDSDRIRDSSRTQMHEIAKALKSDRLKGRRIAIEGHTDSTGGEAYNMGLSKRRAETVRNDLVAIYGIDARRLDIFHFGESKPVASNDTDTGRAENRRVVLVNMGQY